MVKIRKRKRRLRVKKKKSTAKTAKTALRMVKKLKGDVEIKYMTGTNALPQTNYAGQTLICNPDCLGCPNQLAGLLPADPSTQGTAPAAYDYRSIVMQPLRCVQGDNEGQREGEYINMKWINLKGSVSAYPASMNGTSTNGIDYRGRAAKQEVKFIVCLDTSPPRWDAQAAPAAYQTDAAIGYIYNMTNQAEPPVPGSQTTTQLGTNFLRQGAKSPFSLANADLQYDPWHQSYYENDFVQSKKFTKKRFKVLKVWTCRVQQQNNSLDNNTGAGVANFSHTLKLPYRLQYKSKEAQLPTNQNIVVFVQSNTRVPIVAGGLQSTQPPICVPQVILQAKVAYSDL